MFSIFYQKNNNSVLFETFNKNNLVDIQNYIPLYQRFFNLQPSNYQKINLNQYFNITSVEKTENSNKFSCTIQSKERELKTEAFFKFSPLLDPIKYMIGKYGTLGNDVKSSLPTLTTEENSCHPKVLDPNNSAYVDGFFTYLTSNLLHTHNFIHGVDFFGSFLGIHKNFKIDIIDDIEYLNESMFFHENKNNLFDVNISDEDLFLESNTRNYRKKINIGEINNNDDILKIDNDMFDGVFQDNIKNNSPSLTEKLVTEYTHDLSNNDSMKTNDSRCSSRSSHTSGDSDLDNNSDLEDNDLLEDSDSDSSSIASSLDSSVVCNATIPDFPVQIICLESMTATLDSLLEEDITDDEWRSCLFQVIMTLVAYQKLFGFTHNDLHTNNIMYIPTKLQYIIYKYNKVYYKVPTYGRLFKIIDFGRSIYKFKGKIICSDSFHSKGDAATQYNCEPYINHKKPRLEPNLSFDLCRLACSLYDYFMETLEDDFDTNPIAKLIDTWCTDDKNRNILYKKCGEERYPDFKLYKMIARGVHNHKPSKYVTHDVFSRYVSNRKKCRKKKIQNIDDLPCYI